MFCIRAVLLIKTLLIDWLNTNPLETLTVPHLVKKFPEFYRTRCLIPTIARALQPVPILSQINPLHASPSYLMKIHFNIFLSTPRSSKPYFPHFSPRNSCIHVSTMRAIWYTHLIIPHFITPIRLVSNTNHEASLLQSPLISSLLGPNNLLSIFSHTLSLT